MKKFLAFSVFGFVLIAAMLGFLTTDQHVVFADNQTCQVVATECSIYKDEELSDFVRDQENNIIRLKHGQVLTVLNGSVAQDPNYIYIETTDENRYRGYIYRYYVTFNQNDITVYPVFNAKVVVEKARVYNLEMQETELFLEKGCELYLYEGYKRKAEWTPIVCILENGELYYGFMATDDLSPNGVNSGLIIGIMVVISCVTIILLLVFMKKTKKVKKKKIAEMD